ncbi:unnamed protein product [Pleuronectes platessa]|uniref:Uncharacterized protein n=1 Tax=Pleuronectes platessa TaxID=8262 RepID=A0A9N7V6R0_PLEPL|nr:unnamed protein product [Pleuronectes platessa]
MRHSHGLRCRCVLSADIRATGAADRPVARLSHTRRVPVSEVPPACQFNSARLHRLTFYPEVVFCSQRGAGVQTPQLSAAHETLLLGTIQKCDTTKLSLAKVSATLLAVDFYPLHKFPLQILSVMARAHSQFTCSVSRVEIETEGIKQHCRGYAGQRPGLSLQWQGPAGAASLRVPLR